MHDDTRSQELTSRMGADGVTAGTDIYLAQRQGDSRGDAGLHLLAHEAAHVVQQARLRPDRWLEKGVPAGCCLAGLEDDADRLASLIVAGGSAPSVGTRVTPTPTAYPRLMQRHASWEHRLLGDQSTDDLITIAMKSPQRAKILTAIRDFLGMWRYDPDAVTPQMIAAKYPKIRCLQLATSGLLVTYGELNTLPDYMPNPIVLDAQPRSIMLPILQAVRQEGYNRVNLLLTGTKTTTKFAYAVSTPWQNTTANLLFETLALDTLTANVGPAKTNHYTAVVGRNACHFAPYSWYRWQQFHLIARNLAIQAHAAGDDPTRQARLTAMAWRNHGYADHFLQDSFAAGHLVNKNLIMQWFVEWANASMWVPVKDWDKVKHVTTAEEPGLAAWTLYTTANPGSVRDPQTAEEQATLAARMAMAGISGTGLSQAAGYVNYLAFLNSTVVQSASGVLHDYFNENSLWVGSTAHPQPYELRGDDTMLNGGDGVGIASATAQMSQQALVELLSDGATLLSTQNILDQFPTTVRPGSDQQMISLKDWNSGLREQAMGIFPKVHYLAMMAHPRIDTVSVDAVGGTGWNTMPGKASTIAAGADGSVWCLASSTTLPGGHAVYAWNGADWDPKPGAGARIAVGIDGLPWLVNTSNSIYHMNATGARDEMPGTAVDIACGADGSVWCLGTEQVSGGGGYGVYVWTGAGWDANNGSGARIAVGADGLPWLINKFQDIYHLDAEGGWYQQPGHARSIAVGQNSDDATWITTTTDVPGGGSIATRSTTPWSTGGGWVPVEGGLVELAVDATGATWGVNNLGVIVRRGVRATAATLNATTPGPATASAAETQPADIDDSAQLVPPPPGAES